MSTGIAPREDRPSYVIFERRPVEDRTKSLEMGRYMTMDVDFVIITPIGSKDRIPRRVSEWFTQLDQQVTEERVRPSHVQQYKDAYAAWKRGEEIPLAGTPIKGWPVLSPAQQQNILGADIRTVEDLAQVNDEAMKRMGMGSLELKEKAQAWLKQASGPGVVAQEVGALKAENRQLRSQVDSLTRQIGDMKLEMETLGAQLARQRVAEVS